MSVIIDVTPSGCNSDGAQILYELLCGAKKSVLKFTYMFCSTTGITFVGMSSLDVNFLITSFLFAPSLCPLEKSMGLLICSNSISRACLSNMVLPIKFHHNLSVSPNDIPNITMMSASCINRLQINTSFDRIASCVWGLTITSHISEFSRNDSL